MAQKDEIQGLSLLPFCHQQSVVPHLPQQRQLAKQQLDLLEPIQKTRPSMRLKPPGGWQKQAEAAHLDGLEARTQPS
jgi:hypothetical protein